MPTVEFRLAAGPPGKTGLGMKAGQAIKTGAVVKSVA